MIEARTNIGSELVRRAHELKECRGVHLMLGEIGELGELFRVVLRPGDNECEPVLGSGGWRLADTSYEGADELLCWLVALYEIRLATHSDREYEGRLNLVGMGSGDDEIVHRVVRSLLERDTHDAAFPAKFGGGVADQEVGEVRHRNLPLEGHTTTARRVWARPLRQRAVPHVLWPCLAVAGSHHQTLCRAPRRVNGATHSARWALRSRTPRHSAERRRSSIKCSPSSGRDGRPPRYDVERPHGFRCGAQRATVVAGLEWQGSRSTWPRVALSALHLPPNELVREMRVAAALLWYSRGEILQSIGAAVARIKRAEFIDRCRAIASESFGQQPMNDDEIRSD
jgi:hypothetical protein